jgi:hypothetical protein
MKVHDVIVVGSGCSGAMAAQTLVEGGANVTMLDVGVKKPPETPKIPDKDFLTIRRTDQDQYKYLIGENASGVNWGKVGKGEQITPPRKYIMDLIDRFIPVDSKTFSSFESLGYGGLGIGWGLQCWEYSPADLKAAGLDLKKMHDAYNVVANRIGISATNDDAAEYTIGTLTHFQPSPSMDRNHKLISQKYSERKKYAHKKGFVLGRTPLALLSRDKQGRKKYGYKDMDFYSDNDQSAWRPWMTIDGLKKHKNFNYIGGYLVLKFVEKKSLGHVEVHCLDVANEEIAVFYCHKLVLASSALGTARIVLRSFGELSRLPLLCNPYMYVPCIQPRLIGKEAEKNKLGFTQLSLFLDENHSHSNFSVASLYSYQSLMLFRLLKQVPLNFRAARRLMQYLQTGIVIMGIHHADTLSTNKYVKLKKDARSVTGDTLHISYKLDPEQFTEGRRREKKFLKIMRHFGTYPIKRVDPGFGASIHYAGTVPFSKKAMPGTLSYDGRLHKTNSVYVADSSGFNFLPAQGLTFSLMANAHIVAERVLHS